jgi:hypothetical protein
MSEQVALWSAFAARIELRFPFRVDVLVAECEHGRHSCSPGCDRARMSVRLHVLDRDTREPITVLTRRPCAPWTSDEDAVSMLLDLLEIALKHETLESVWIDGRLTLDLHAERR